MNSMSGINYCEISSPNSYVGILEGITALEDGMRLSFKVDGASTDAVTINLNTLGAKKAIKGSDNSTQIGNGDLVDNGSYDAVYNSDADSGNGAFIIMNK